MKTRGYTVMYLCSLVAYGFMITFGFIYRYFTGGEQGITYFNYTQGVLGIVTDVAFLVGLIGTIVTSNNKGKAASAVFGLPIGLGLLVACFFMIRGLVEEGLPSVGYMMVFGFIPIPLGVIFGIMVISLPMLGGIAIYRSVRILSYDLLKLRIFKHSDPFFRD